MRRLLASHRSVSPERDIGWLSPVELAAPVAVPLQYSYVASSRRNPICSDSGLSRRKPHRKSDRECLASEPVTGIATARSGASVRRKATSFAASLGLYGDDAFEDLRAQLTTSRSLVSAFQNEPLRDFEGSSPGLRPSPGDDPSTHGGIARRARSNVGGTRP